MDWIGVKWIELNWIGLGWIGLDWIGWLNCIWLNWIALNWIGFDLTELDWVGLHWIGLYLIGLDWIGLNCDPCKDRLISKANDEALEHKAIFAGITHWKACTRHQHLHEVLDKVRATVKSHKIWSVFWSLGGWHHVDFGGRCAREKHNNGEEPHKKSHDKLAIAISRDTKWHTSQSTIYARA